MAFPLHCICSRSGNCPVVNREVSKGHFRECRRSQLFRNRVYQRAGLPKLPSLLKQTFTFGKAVFRHIMARCPTVTNEEMERRQAICRDCDQYLNGRCAKCGCRLKSKTAWALEKCPLEKW